MNPYNFGGTLHEKAQTLRRRYDADHCHVSHYDGSVSYQLEWETDEENDGRSAEEMLDFARDVLTNLPSPEPDNVDFHAGYNLRVSFEYGFSESDDEANGETETQNQEE